MDTNILPYGKISSAKKLGQAVRAKRKADGLTQVKTAALCGVGIRFISDLENGKPTIELGKALSVVTGLGLAVDVRPKGALNQNRDKDRNVRDAQKVHQNKVFEMPDSYKKTISKLANAYNDSFNMSSKAFDDLVKHRKDFYSLGITMDKYNDIAKSYKHILNVNSSAISKLNDVKKAIDKVTSKNIISDKITDSIRASVYLNNDALKSIRNLQSTVKSLNLDTNGFYDLQYYYKKNLKLSNDAIKKLSYISKKG